MVGVAGRLKANRRQRVETGWVEGREMRGMCSRPRANEARKRCREVENIASFLLLLSSGLPWSGIQGSIPLKWCNREAQKWKKSEKFHVAPDRRLRPHRRREPQPE